jgi:catechol 1,2-dioxygenase
VAYPAAPHTLVYRPAHIHLRLSGAGQQDLIIQLYLQGDAHLESDPCAAAPDAINRILAITASQCQEKMIHFDVVLSDFSSCSNSVLNF